MSESSQFPHEPQTPGSHYQPTLGVVLVILLLFVGATYLMLRTPGTASPGSGVTTTSTTTATTNHTTSTTVPKAQVRVQVANGTSVTGLARTFTQQLMTLGWDALPEMNGPKVTTTTVYFKVGYQWAAREIVSEIKATKAQVKPLGNLTPVAGASGDDIVVILGPDVAIKG